MTRIRNSLVLKYIKLQNLLLFFLTSETLVGLLTTQTTLATQAKRNNSTKESYHIDLSFFFKYLQRIWLLVVYYHQTKLAIFITYYHLSYLLSLLHIFTLSYFVVYAFFNLSAQIPNQEKVMSINNKHCMNSFPASIISMIKDAYRYFIHIGSLILSIRKK